MLFKPTLMTLGWPLLCLVLALLVWQVILGRSVAERTELLAGASGQASWLARAYAGQLTRSLRQLDHITLTLKYDWEHLRDNSRLDNQFRSGVFPGDSLVFALLTDANGLVHSASPGARNLFSLNDQPYFITQQSQPQAGLLISQPQAISAGSPPAVYVSRRLENADGGFDGIVLVAVKPAYLSWSLDEPTTGRNDFFLVSTVDDGGIVSAGLRDTQAGSDASPHRFLNIPKPQTAHGVTSMPGQYFSDLEPHIVAWQKLEPYPLIAMVGLQEQDILAPYLRTEREYRNLGFGISALLAALAAAGVLVAARLARRKQQSDDVKNTYQLAVDGAHEGFYMVRGIFDDQGKLCDFLIEDCNERGAELVGYERQSLVGTRFLDAYSGAHAQRILEIFAIAMEKGFYEDEVPVSPQSPLKSVWLYRRLVRSGDGLAMTVRDISEAKAHQQLMSDLANLDPVTTLPNRHWLMNFLPQALEQARRANSRLALLFVDLDDFKNINDALGHSTGDALLKATALRLRALIHPHDHVVRLGGDEFTIILQQIDHTEDISRVTRLLLRALNEPFTLPGQGQHLVRASIGISIFPQDGGDTETLLKHADIAMYAAKANGKFRHEHYRPEFSDILLLRLEKEQDLRCAIDRHEFLLHYQPRVDAFTGALCGMEALVRWAHPQHGLLLPDEFIQVAEETGLILEIGETLIDQAIAQIAQWRQAGLPMVPVSINVSALQFGQGHLRPVLAASLARHAVPADLVEIEITESCMLGATEVVSNQLAALRELGIMLLVDDFGTGYSSLSQLQQLDMDVLKIDRAFTSRIGADQNSNVLLQTIVSMAHALNMRVVAEGVETVAQVHALQDMQCNEIQGFVIAPALPPSEIPALMQGDSLFPAQVRPNPQASGERAA